jgi:hypothetical protein
MKRLAYFIDALDTRLPSIVAAMQIADYMDAFLDVHHPWASRENLSGRPGWRPVPPENVVDSGRADARALFREACGERRNARFVGVDGHFVDAIRSFGVAYDFIITDRLAKEEGRKPYAFNTALFESGAPVLIMPPTLPTQIENCVVVIWSGTSQSGRALRAALPILEKAKKVFVLSNSTNPMANPATATDYLNLHGIKCKGDYFDGSGLTARGRGRAIIKAASSMDADLMIMGAFGHNGIERIFDLGRTTRKLVTATPIPLLMQS